MKLTEEKIKKNGIKYFETGEKYNAINEELIQVLGTDFIGAPSTTRTDMGNAHEGGLVQHILLVTKYLVSLNGVLPEALQIEMDSLIKVGLIHQIGKTHLFVPIGSDWHEKRGIMYDFNNDLPSMRVSERSLKMAMDCGIKFTDDEYIGILNFDKEDSDKQSKYHNTVIGNLLRTANTLAQQEELF